MDSSPDEEFKRELFNHLGTVAHDDDWSSEPDETYALVLRHIISTINPKDSARGIIFALQKRLERLEQQ